MTTQEQRRTRRNRSRQASNAARHRIVGHLREKEYVVDGTEPMENLVAALNELWEDEKQRAAQLIAQEVQA